MSTGAWELVFMMLVLKLPIAYLIGVVWWAVRAAPDPYEPAALIPAEPKPEPLRPCTWRAHRRRPQPRGPSPRARIGSVRA
jgi:hypothetical protein